MNFQNFKTVLDSVGGRLHSATPNFENISSSDRKIIFDHAQMQLKNSMTLSDNTIALKNITHCAKKEFR